MFNALLIAHICVATASTLLLAIFAVQLLQHRHTERLAHKVFLSTILTTFSGLLLFISGADMTRTCITMCVYVLIAFFLLQTAKKRGYRVEAPYKQSH